MRRAILTYDLGTTRLKVALFAPSGRLLGQRAARHAEQSREDRQWQAADQWWSDAVRLTRELLSHKAVTIEEPRGIIRSDGLVLDSESRTLRLNANVRGTLAPPAPTK